jgi:Putative peptidoglycan binding domain
MSIRVPRQPLLALAGTAVGLTSVVVPTAAYAGPAPAPQAVEAPAAKADVTAAAAPYCYSWTDFVTGPGTPYTVPIPSTTRNGGESNCILGRGNQTEGVYKLQNALNRCYGQNLTVDGVYGAATERAVKNVQAKYGLPQDGVYGPQTRAAMTWPKYLNGQFNHC